MAEYKIVGGDRQEYGPVGEDQVREWIAQGRANGETLVQMDGGLWKKLSSFPEFADALRLGGPPALPKAEPASVPPVAPALPAVPGSWVGTDPKRVVSGPAIALLATGVLDLVVTGLGLLAAMLGMTGAWASHGWHPPGAPMGPEMNDAFGLLLGPIGMAGDILGMVVSGLIIWGAWRMLSLKNYGLCMVVSILAVVPCTAPCCCLGIAAGIWSLVILNRPEVKAAFS